MPSKQEFELFEKKCLKFPKTLDYIDKKLKSNGYSSLTEFQCDIMDIQHSVGVVYGGKLRKVSFFSGADVEHFQFQCNQMNTMLAYIFCRTARLSCLKFVSVPTATVIPTKSRMNIGSASHACPAMSWYLQSKLATVIGRPK